MYQNPTLTYTSVYTYIGAIFENPKNLGFKSQNSGSLGFKSQNSGIFRTVVQRVHRCRTSFFFGFSWKGLTFSIWTIPTQCPVSSFIGVRKARMWEGNKIEKLWVTNQLSILRMYKISKTGEPTKPTQPLWKGRKEPMVPKCEIIGRVGPIIHD